MILQYRDLTLFPRDERYVTKKWNRVVEENLKKELLKRNNILSIHIGAISLISVQSTSLSLHEQKQCQSNDDDEEEDRMIMNQEQSPPPSPPIPLIIKDGSFYSTKLNEKFEVSRTIKELTLDIDITDYKRFCQCGTNKSVCSTCWLHLEGTALILNDILTNGFGVNEMNIMWVFSGAKGIHCFINDSNMIKMTNTQRMNIYDHISIDKENNYISLRDKYDNGFFSESLIEDIEKLFHDKVLVERSLLDEDGSFQEFLLNKIKLHYFHLYGMVKKAWESIKGDSLYKWQALKKIEDTCHQSSSSSSSLKASLYLILSLYYPMIDKAPLRLNHLIKLPFSVHKGSGKISLPMDLKSITNYAYIQRVPTLLCFIQEREGLCDVFNRGVSILDTWISHFL